MHLFNILTIFVLLLLIGVELCVTVFIGPVLRRLDPESEATALSLFASLLGRVMPFWYFACFLLLVAEVWLHRHTPALFPLLIAAALWLAMIIFSIAVLVPINNRLAARSAADWREQSRRWDSLHRLRVLVLAIAVFCLLWNL